MAANTTARKRAPKKAAAPKPAVAAEEMSPAEFDAELARLTDVAPDELVDADGNVVPLEIGKAGRTPNPLIHVFTLDDVKYGMPSRPNPAGMLKFQRAYARASRLPTHVKGNPDANPRADAQNLATMDFLLDMLGEDALDALSSSPDVGEEEMAAVFARVAKIGFGGLAKTREATQGN